jgi:hypothetical protein
VDAHREAVAACAGAHAVLAALRIHVHSATVCEYACRVLVNLALLPENRVLLGSLGAVDVVLAVLGTSGSGSGGSEAVLYYACCALLNLCAHACNVAALRDSDGVRHLHTLGHNHAHSDKLTAIVGRALRTFNIPFS